MGWRYSSQKPLELHEMQIKRKLFQYKIKRKQPSKMPAALAASKQIQKPPKMKNFQEQE